MSMGMLNDIEGFKTVYKLKEELCDDQLPEEEFVVSMGTSQDYEMAIQEGSTEVRLGTTIFGARDYSK